MKNPNAQALGKLGGSSKSEAKKLASRENGKKGGYPKGRPRTKLIDNEKQNITKGQSSKGTQD